MPTSNVQSRRKPSGGSTAKIAAKETARRKGKKKQNTTSVTKLKREKEQKEEKEIEKEVKTEVEAKKQIEIDREDIKKMITLIKELIDLETKHQIEFANLREKLLTLYRSLKPPDEKIKAKKSIWNLKYE